MDFDFSSDQYALRDEARRFLEEQCPTSYVREFIDEPSAWSRDLWKQMAELGWTALAFPESCGGLGQSFLDVVLLIEELGRAIAPVPFFSSIVLAGQTILAHGSPEQQRTLLAPLASGARIAVRGLATADTRSENGKISGAMTHVLDAPAADVIVVGFGDAWYVVEEGFTALPAGAFDRTRSIGTVAFDNAPAEKLERDSLMPGLLFGAAGMCAEMVGTAQRLLDETVAYTKVREQFGRPIGSFQAIKHRCAEMATDLEAARAAAYYACWAVSTGADDAELATSVAKSFCGEALSRLAGEGVQVHGGIAFTWEQDTHLYLRRIKSAEALFGNTAHHRERIARIAGL